MAPNKREKIHDKFKELLEELENENIKVIYITYESTRLKIAFWDEHNQQSDLQSMTIERD